MKVDLVAGDHQNKPDVGSGIARKLYDVENVDAIVDVPNSGVALAVNQVRDEEEQGLFGLQRGNFGPDRAEMLTQHCALDLRHLDARACGTGWANS